MAENVEKVKAPFGPPDVVWVKGSDTLPESIIVCGKSDAKDVYAGRTYHEGELLIGTVIAPGSCIYSKDGNVYKTSEYETMTVPVGDPLIWAKVSAEEPLPDDLVKAGALKNNEYLYVGRVVIDNSTVIGWVSKDKFLHVCVGETEKVVTEFEILVHRFLKFLCICPPCPRSKCE